MKKTIIKQDDKLFDCYDDNGYLVKKKDVYAVMKEPVSFKMTYRFDLSTASEAFVNKNALSGKGDVCDETVAGNKVKSIISKEGLLSEKLLWKAIFKTIIFEDPADPVKCCGISAVVRSKTNSDTDWYVFETPYNGFLNYGYDSGEYIGFPLLTESVEPGGNSDVYLVIGNNGESDYTEVEYSGEEGPESITVELYLTVDLRKVLESIPGECVDLSSNPTVMAILNLINYG